MATINGTEGNDTINGTSDADSITANGGDDTVNGKQGADTIEGADTMRGGDQDDVIYGGDGDDSLMGNFDNDTIYGEGGNDYIHGGEQNDELYGGAGNDRLIGQLGDDLLFGGAGIDTLEGGDGADTLYATAGDVVGGGSGTDVVIVRGPVRVQPSGTSDWYVVNPGETLSLTALGNTDGTIEYLDGDGNPTGQTVSYTSSESVSSQSTMPACYAAGTLIATPGGPRSVETLAPGDMVLTLDHGPQALRWVRRDRRPLAVGAKAPPVLIAAAALGPDRPSRDLVVSAQHRVLVGGGRQMQPLFTREALVAAKALTGLPGIRSMRGKSQVRWVHFACDRHEIVLANGALAESLLVGPMVRDAAARAERAQLAQVFGDAIPAGAPLNGPAARPCLKVGAVRRLIEDQRQRAGARQALTPVIAPPVLS